jgi:DNA-binding transcriptional ArsR family regulator/uncharacterized protein YndB with AHSA1/START domain
MSADGVWRALANPHRRRMLDLLADRPMVTGEVARAIPGLSRYAVMQHLGVLEDAGLIVVRRRGRLRFNHLNPVPLRRWYERWVQPMADHSAAQLLAVERAITDAYKESPEMPSTATPPSSTSPATEMAETIRTVRLEAELSFDAAPERVFAALTKETLGWFPHSYGGERTRAVVMEERAGGALYEDWGDGAGYLYGHVTEWDPPHSLSFRSRVMPGSLMDTRYDISQAGSRTVLKMSKVATGPMTAEEAQGIRQFGDIMRFEEGLRRVIEGVAADTQ